MRSRLSLFVSLVISVGIAIAPVILLPLNPSYTQVSKSWWALLILFVVAMFVVLQLWLSSFPFVKKTVPNMDHRVKEVFVMFRTLLLLLLAALISSMLLQPNHPWDMIVSLPFLLVLGVVWILAQVQLSLTLPTNQKYHPFETPLTLSLLLCVALVGILTIWPNTLPSLLQQTGFVLTSGFSLQWFGGVSWLNAWMIEGLVVLCLHALVKTSLVLGKTHGKTQRSNHRGTPWGQRLAIISTLATLIWVGSKNQSHLQQLFSAWKSEAEVLWLISGRSPEYVLTGLGSNGWRVAVMMVGRPDMGWTFDTIPRQPSTTLAALYTQAGILPFLAWGALWVCLLQAYRVTSRETRPIWAATLLLPVLLLCLPPHPGLILLFFVALSSYLQQVVCSSLLVTLPHINSEENAGKIAYQSSDSSEKNRLQVIAPFFLTTVSLATLATLGVAMAATLLSDADRYTASLALSQEQYGRSVAMLTRAIERTPLSAATTTQYTETLLYTSSFVAKGSSSLEIAARIATVSRLLSPNDPMSSLLSARIAASQVLLASDAIDADTVKTYYEQTATRAPHWAVAYTELGVFYLQIAQPSLALEPLRTAVTLDPTSIQAMAGLAAAQQGTGDLLNALGTYKNLLKLLKNNPETYEKVTAFIQNLEQTLGSNQSSTPLNANQKELLQPGLTTIPFDQPTPTPSPSPSPSPLPSSSSPLSVQPVATPTSTSGTTTPSPTSTVAPQTTPVPSGTSSASSPHPAKTKPQPSGSTKSP